MNTLRCVVLATSAVLIVSLRNAGAQNQNIRMVAPSVSMNYVVGTENKIVTADGFPYHRALVDVMKELGDVRTDRQREGQCQRAVNLQTNMNSSFQAFGEGMTALLTSLKSLSKIQKSLANGQGQGDGQGVKILMSGDIRTKSKQETAVHGKPSIASWAVAGVFAVLFLVTLCVLIYYYRRQRRQPSEHEGQPLQDTTYYGLQRNGDGEYTIPKNNPYSGIQGGGNGENKTPTEDIYYEIPRDGDGESKPLKDDTYYEIPRDGRQETESLDL